MVTTSKETITQYWNPWRRWFLYGSPEVMKGEEFASLVEAGSNTSNVAPCVVGGNKKGSFESDTVKYDLRWRGPADPSSRQRERPTSTNPQQSDSNKNLVVSPRWVLDTKADWPGLLDAVWNNVRYREGGLVLYLEFNVHLTWVSRELVTSLWW
jgi:hypothetical protein